jgi:hypothetical protein
VWQAAANNKAVADVEPTFGIFSMPQKQALYSEFSQPNRISHSVRH